MQKTLWGRVLSWIDAGMTTSAQRFLNTWGKLERLYRRPAAKLTTWLKFAFYPLLAVAALGWLGWDMSHGKQLDAAEDAVFDQIIKWRPFEPKPSGKVVIVEIDDCSIGHFNDGWPWSRMRHAELLDQLDQAGVRAVGYDVQFPDRSSTDKEGDESISAAAEGAEGRFIFASAFAGKDFASDNTITADQAPGAFAFNQYAKRPGPRVALLAPFDTRIEQYSALANISRSEEGMIRDIPLYYQVGDWGIPTLPLRIFAAGKKIDAAQLPETIRPNWRSKTQLQYVSAADVLEGKVVCGDKNEPMPSFKDKTVLVGSTASGLFDVKPTPINPTTPGVAVWAEATEALLANSAIRTPPIWLKYLLAALLVVLTTFAFWRGEPTSDIDSIFVAVNLLLIAIAFVGLSGFGMFFDIFASIGFVSAFFGVCRLYASIQKGHAIGDDDYLDGYDPENDNWLVMARLRFQPHQDLGPKIAARQRREYRRRLRRFMYEGRRAVMIEGVVERKSWLHSSLDDLMLLVWKGYDEAAARDAASRELLSLYEYLHDFDLRLEDGGVVNLHLVSARIDDQSDESIRGERMRLREAFGRLLAAEHERPLSRQNPFVVDDIPSATPAPTEVTP